MKTAIACFAAALACLTASAATPITRLCDKVFAYGEVSAYFGNTGLASQFAALASDPAGQPELFQRLLQPKQVAYGGYIFVTLGYGDPQDAAEIAAALNADPVLRSMGALGFSPRTRAMDFSALPPPVRVTATEYYNRVLDHYFLSSSEAENAIIDAGGAGPGWERTGERINTFLGSLSHGIQRVFRFYSAASKSHFFTIDPAECGSLRNTDPGWQYEGEAFGAKVPSNGTCPAGTTAVYRLYNNRWRENDSNHRFVTRLDLYNQMTARGWLGEGVAMCAVN